MGVVDLMLLNKVSNELLNHFVINMSCGCHFLFNLGCCRINIFRMIIDKTCYRGFFALMCFYTIHDVDIFVLFFLQFQK